MGSQKVEFFGFVASLGCIEPYGKVKSRFGERNGDNGLYSEFSGDSFGSNWTTGKC